MVSFRKKLQDDKKDAAVAALPQENAARLPEPIAEDVEPLEQLAAESDPVREAEQSALKQRLQEMQNAETIVRSSVGQQPRFADEPQKPKSVEEIIEGCNLPERAKSWLREHPDYVTDPVKVAQITAMHPAACSLGGEAFSDSYFDSMERLLFDMPKRGAPFQDLRPNKLPRNNGAAPVRQQQAAGGAVPVSAPPTRDAPSMSTGRPVSGPTRLTQEQLDVARSLGI